MSSPFKFGKASNDKLKTCHPDLVRVAELALSRSPVDFTIVWGWRDAAQQNAMVAAGASKTPWPKSKHNATNQAGEPASNAIDFAPVVGGTIPWKDTHLFAVVAGVLMSAAVELGVRLRWGGDWNMNGLTTDQTFMDWGHVERLE